MAAIRDLHGVNLPKRYEIRKVTAEMDDWCLALLAQGLLLRAPSWRPLIPEPRVKTVLQQYQSTKPYYESSLKSGLSYVIYDREYIFKRAESEVSGGALYLHEIDLEDPELETKGEEWILEKLDIPIVALGLSYDLFYKPSKEAYASMSTVSPLWHQMLVQYEKEWTNPSDIPKPTAPGQYVHRSAQVTRSDHEGRGLGRLFSWWIMSEMAAKGYRGILAGAGNATIGRIWLRSDAPFTTKVVMEQDMSKVEIELNGEKFHPFQGRALKDFNYLLCDLTQKNV